MAASNRARKVGALYIPQQIEELKSLAEEQRRLLERSDELQERLLMDIADGWSTGDPLEDFIISACNGMYNTTAIRCQYDWIQDQFQICGGKYVLIVQQAEYFYEEFIYILRNVYFGQPRADNIIFDINQGLMGLPIQMKYLVYREMMTGEDMAKKWIMLDAPLIYVGPLLNECCTIERAERCKERRSFVPSRAACQVFFHPWNHNVLFQDCGIDEEFLGFLTDQFILGNTLP